METEAQETSTRAFEQYKPGTLLEGPNERYYLKLAENDMHHTENMVVDLATGTICHFSAVSPLMYGAWSDLMGAP